MQKLISIIIPVYNRAHLIAETLDSILNQTYTYWECIIVDDGSTDRTIEVIKPYLIEDSRFKLFKRPDNRPKGPQACRNYGFEKSNGEFIQWFDSDDLMLPNKLEIKLNAFDDTIDFVISNSINFNENGEMGRPFQLKYEVPINAENFIRHNIGWITGDVLLKREVIKVSFDENIFLGCEYLFYSKLLFVTNRGKYIKEDLTKRRIHNEGLMEMLAKDPEQYKKNLLIELGVIDIIKNNDRLDLLNRSLKRIVRFSYQHTPRHRLDKIQFKVLQALFENKYYLNTFKYSVWIILNLVFGKGYFLIKQINDNLK